MPQAKAEHVPGAWQRRQWFFGEIEAMQQVLRVCETWGYGNVMQVIACAWADKDPLGALTVGPARGRRGRRAKGGFYASTQDENTHH